MKSIFKCIPSSFKLPTRGVAVCNNHFLGKNIEVVENYVLASDGTTEIFRMVADVGKEWGVDYGPGQFVMIRSAVGDERIPLTVTKYDQETGYLSLVYQVAGTGTMKFSKMKPGDTLEDVTYPLGTPLEIEEPVPGKDITYIVAGGVGIAPAYAKTKAFHEAGYDVRMLLSARNEELLILLEDMYESIGLKYGEPSNGKVLISTDDGSYDGVDALAFENGDRGMFGVEALKQIIDYEGKEPTDMLLDGGYSNTLKPEQISEVFAVGPLMMMKAVANATEPMGIPTFASLNTVMIDGSGMCGGCKISNGDQDFYVCKDGPTANCAYLDWDGMKASEGTFSSHEKLSRELYNLETIVGEVKVSDTEGLLEDNYLSRLCERFGVKSKDVTVDDLMEKMLEEFGHVSGYLSARDAVLEAAAMCTCPEDGKRKPCQKKCPVNIDIQGFIHFLKPQFMAEAFGVEEDQLEEILMDLENKPEYLEKMDRQVFNAFKVIKAINPIPEITGLVCPQELQCQSRCASAFRKEKGPTPIGKLESFVANWIRTNRERISAYGWDEDVEKIMPKNGGKKVMIVGSGPSGLVCASELAKAGHDITIYETLSDGGGVLMYGIPEFRLPKGIVAHEVEQIAGMGVKIELNRKIADVEKHMKLYGFDACFIGTGAGIPNNLWLDNGELLPGQDLVGCYSANEFLTRTNLMKGYLFPKSETPPPDVVGKNVVVFGGGNVAMDSARSALRLGAKEVTIMYRRGAEEIPARAEEFHHAQLEGIKFMFLATPLEFIGNENKEMVKIRYQLNELGEADESGRRSPIPIEGEIHDMDAQVAVIAVGQGPNKIMDLSSFDLERGRIIVDPKTMQTNVPGVCAGGDIIEGNEGTVIYAAGCGLSASKYLIDYLDQLE